MRRIRFHPLALRELHSAAHWHDRERPGAGKRLLDEVTRFIGRIITAPDQGSPYLYGTRRFILHRFPYSSVYVAVDRPAHLIAIAHHKRRPGYWRRRLRDIH
jgi:toxin ParE1/3/4